MSSLGEVFLITAAMAGLFELGLWIIEKVSGIPAIKRKMRVNYDSDEDDW